MERSFFKLSHQFANLCRKRKGKTVLAHRYLPVFPSPFMVAKPPTETPALVTQRQATAHAVPVSPLSARPP